MYYKETHLKYLFNFNLIICSISIQKRADDHVCCMGASHYYTYFILFLRISRCSFNRNKAPVKVTSKLSRFLRRSLVSNSVPFLHFRYGSLKRCRSKLRRVKKLCNTSLHMQLRSGCSAKV